MSVQGPGPSHENSGAFRAALNTIGKLANRAITWIRKSASGLARKFPNIFRENVNTQQSGQAKFKASADPLASSKKEQRVALQVEWFSPDDDEFGAVPGPPDPELPKYDPPPPPTLTKSPDTHPTHYQKIPAQPTPGGKAPPIPERPAERNWTPAPDIDYPKEGPFRKRGSQ